MTSRGSIIQLLRGISRHNQFFYSLKGKNSTRKFSPVLQSKYHSIQCARGILRLNQCLYSLKAMISIRKYSSVLPNKFQENKYGELRNRLEKVPYINLVDKVADRVEQDLCNENGEGLEDVLKWYSKVFVYNVRNNETLYPTTLLKTFCTYGFNMDDPSWKQWDSEAWKSAAIVAWCVKLKIAYTNIVDDIMDNAILRNGKPCWYKKSDVGLGAVNDCILLQTGINKLLWTHLGSSKCYMNILHEFLQATRDTAFGQCMIGRFNFKNHKQGFDKLSFEWYQTLSKYKSAPLCFSLPVFLGMHLAGRCTAEDYEIAKKLCLKLGLYIQSQDDYTDVFGNQEVALSGMMGNDIREGSCTWFSVKFLEEATDSMKKEFLENYGVDNKDAIDTVLELYRKANLKEKFEEFDEQLYKEISTLIESANDVKGYLFYELFNDTHKRER